MLQHSTRAEEILLTVTDGGFGKRSSAYDYRVSGQGRAGDRQHHAGSRRNGTAVVATLPVRRGDDVMLVTDVGRLIRVPADQVRITARQIPWASRFFGVSENERVTSVFPVLDDGSGDPPTEIGVDPAAPPEATGERGPACLKMLPSRKMAERVGDLPGHL